MNFIQPIVWVFLPTPLSLGIINALQAKAVVYYCIDNFRVSSWSAKKITVSEIKLLKTADLVFTTSRELCNYCSRYNRKTHIFPFAVNFEKFDEVRRLTLKPPEGLRGIKRPIVGYVGGIHKWIDLALIKEASENLPDTSFVLVGPVQTDISVLRGRGNIYFFGKKQHTEIPEFINNFDACIIPYLLTDYTRNVYPTKLNEYLALGKPVVSTNLPEVAQFNAENGKPVLIGSSRDEFLRHLRSALTDSNPKALEERIEIAKRNSWPQRIEEMSALIECQIAHKQSLSLNWRQQFLRYYRMSRKRFLMMALPLVFSYLLIFYTPFVWFLASPLKIAEPPRKADAIVVFAGGVGESGQPAQGYTERVQYAVQLYKQGYAENMVFSSGFMYVFKEPLVMKALAVSLGVPADAIVLESNAKNTVENVRFSAEILNSREWGNIILISSPYHMRRASMVFDKVARNINVCYTPIPHSVFYLRGDRDSDGRGDFKKISFQQIKGILHEYLGILYYWWKGWL